MLDTIEHKTFVSAKQIYDTANDFFKQIGEDEESKILTFTELLSWKIPDHICSNLPT
jgi:hypothetical protein